MKEFVVITEKFGNYKKGDVLLMHPSTGKACYKFVKPKSSKKNK